MCLTKFVMFGCAWNLCPRLGLDSLVFLMHATVHGQPYPTVHAASAHKNGFPHAPQVPAPRIKEAAVQMECKLRQVVDINDTWVVMKLATVPCGHIVNPHNATCYYRI